MTNLPNLARLFDMPIDSEEHAGLRDDAWIGGDGIEGPYLLGMLIGENLFLLPNDIYIQRLHDFITPRFSSRAAIIFCTFSESSLLIPYLRKTYELETDYPSIDGPRNNRIENAIEFLLGNLDATDSEIAIFLETTEKQVLRISDITAAKRAIRFDENKQ
ncbi:MAG: hypothetical protein COA78_19350 [Blastopirellula sp.]|nr:MAG: hypothetical protein COA78_19350 [Blastopirellula sp.]